MSALQALSTLHRRHLLRDVDLAFAEVLHRAGGVPEVMLAGALALRAVAAGHSGFTLSRPDAVLLEAAIDVQWPTPQCWSTALTRSPLVCTRLPEFDEDGRNPVAIPLVFEHDRVGLYRYALYEQRLAQALIMRANDAPLAQSATSTTVLAERLQALFTLPVEAGLDRQALAVWMAGRQRLTLITGGPGTGKTTTVARLLALLLESGLDPQGIALAAPTGRAAARLAEAIAQSTQRDQAAGLITPALADTILRPAQTLHRLLGWQPGTVRFRFHAQRPLPLHTVIVDEASMIDLPLMAKLVAAVPPEARLILLGDPAQLPAVEAGHVLGALCTATGDGMTLTPHAAEVASMALNCSVPQAENDTPLADCRIHLTQSYRQQNAPALAQLAEAVRQGDRVAALTHLAAPTDALHWHSASLASLEIALHQEVLPMLRALQALPDPLAALRQARRWRMLTALRHGPFGACDWNTWFSRHLAGNTDVWFHGRLLMITENSYRHDLFNGDVGIAWEAPSGEWRVWFEHQRQPWSPRQLPAHETAFVSTIHKAQGSEYDRVLLLLPKADSRILSRELLYTGLTRARERVDLWASREAIEQSIQQLTERDTGLPQRLSEVATARTVAHP